MTRISSAVVGGELVPLQLPLTERPLSSSEDTDPLKLDARLRFVTALDSTSSSSTDLGDASVDPD